jgi:hypothetical protein
MKEAIGFIILFVIVSVAIIAGQSTIGVIYSTNVGNCAYNSTGSLVNCTLTDSDYQLLNKTSTLQYTAFTTLSWSTFLIVIAFIAALLYAISLIVK